MREGAWALEARDVVKSFGTVRALDSVSLRVAEGESLALVGESGSGKTTLLRTFNRMVDVDAGEVRVGDASVADLEPVALRRSLGYVQQEGGLLPHWPVLRNVALVPRLQAREDADLRARQALELVGLDADEFGGRWPGELSGGQRQRVALARALADRPSVVLLDEPFGALDAITREEIQEAFVGVVRRLGVTLLLVTHDLREAFLLCRRVAVMRAGCIEQVGAPEELRTSPETRYVADLLRKAGVA
ncbi:MAG: ATP-binding cassette domain-containing protein [Gemmatimonadetes bacterium]|nr:ATP-binding cassette domain-containing protein [Gemmatimonadota bacterium]